MSAARRSLAAACTLTLAVGVAGCGGGSSGVSPAAYAGSLCSAIKPFESDIAKQADALDPTLITNPASGKQALETFLGGLASDSRAASARLAHAGTPKVRNGGAIASALAGVFTRLDSSLGRAAAEARGLPTSSVSAFRTAEERLGSGVETSLGDLGSGLHGLKSQALETAAKQAPACRSLS